MAEQKKQVIIYTDGACDPNPGRGGYGAVLLYGQVRKEVSGGLRQTTNNRMEIYAAIKGLEMLKESCKVTLYSDSQYVVNAMTQGWVARWQQRSWRRAGNEPALNADLWKQLTALCEKHEVSFVWIRGHNGNVENERCDRLSTAFISRRDLAVDEGYENASPPEPRISAEQEGQPCPKCATPVVLFRTKKRRLMLSCPNCKALYEYKSALPDEANTQGTFF